jgi:hypothetical protein
MLKPGSFYLTKQGQLVKIFNSFQFADGYTTNGAIHLVGASWQAVRFKPDGNCNVDGVNNSIPNFEPFTKYPTYMTFLVWCDRNSNKWCGQAKDLRGQIVISISDIEHRERAMSLIQLGCEQKILTWMREAGYDEETKEVVNA